MRRLTEMFPFCSRVSALPSRDQFVDVERLREIVVGAEVQALQPLVQRAARGDEDDGNGDPPVAQVAQDAQAVAPGDHDVEHQRVVGPGGREGVRVVTVVAEVDREALRLQALAHERGQFPVVLEHQDLHLANQPAADRRRKRPKMKRC